MSVEYSGLIGFGLFFVFIIWLWWYAIYGKTVDSNKSKKARKET